MLIDKIIKKRKTLRSITKPPVSDTYIELFIDDLNILKEEERIYNEWRKD